MLEVFKYKATQGDQKRLAITLKQQGNYKGEIQGSPHKHHHHQRRFSGEENYNVV
jgi:hypothetical protein